MSNENAVLWGLIVILFHNGTITSTQLFLLAALFTAGCPNQCGCSGTATTLHARKDCINIRRIGGCLRYFPPAVRKTARGRRKYKKPRISAAFFAFRFSVFSALSPPWRTRALR